MLFVLISLVGEQTYSAISSCCEYPGLGGMEHAVTNPLMVGRLVATQNFHGDYQWICHEILKITHSLSVRTDMEG